MLDDSESITMIGIFSSEVAVFACSGCLCTSRWKPAQGRKLSVLSISSTASGCEDASPTQAVSTWANWRWTNHGWPFSLASKAEFYAAKQMYWYASLITAAGQWYRVAVWLRVGRSWIYKGWRDVVCFVRVTLCPLGYLVPVYGTSLSYT
jgi:hypothetical protein